MAGVKSGGFRRASRLLIPLALLAVFDAVPASAQLLPARSPESPIAQNPPSSEAGEEGTDDIRKPEAGGIEPDDGQLKMTDAQLNTPDGQLQTTDGADRSDTTQTAGRLFGVLPNSSTIEAGLPVSTVTMKEQFGFAFESSFDKMVFPFVGVVAALGVGQTNESYMKRYATSFADNTVGNYMVTAVLPTLFNQDSRYFQLGSESGFWHRFGYAASRAVITRSRNGRLEFNVSEIGGNALGAVISNAYYPAAERTPSGTLERAGSQVMWDTISFECKEFWPDIRRMLQNTFHHP